MTTCLGKSCSFGLMCVPFLRMCPYFPVGFWGGDVGFDCYF